MASAELFVENGIALLFYAFDVGAGIDLVKAEPLLSQGKQRTQAQEKRRQSKYFEFTPPPIRLTEDAPVCGVGPRFATSPRAELLVFDFGCVSVRFDIPIHGPIKDINELSVELYENMKLQDAAKTIVTNLLAKMRPAVDRPEIASRLEDYVIFHFSKTKPALSPHELLKDHILPLTGLLRAEMNPPSDREIQEILNDRISYGSNDVTLISWYAAFVYGENVEDINAVLEFTNLVLMELSYLDSRLDRALDEFYDYFTEHQRRMFFRISLKSLKPMMRRISQLQIDTAISHERITNALKLMGDDFQARVFQMATKKMGLSSWEPSITRKLQAIESIYQKTSDSEGSRRMEVLEIVIILLIATSILLPLYFPSMAK